MLDNNIAMLPRSYMIIPKELLDHDLIFHFTKGKSAIENILYSGKLRFSPLEEMNDPYEYKMISTGVMTRRCIDEETVNKVSAMLRRVILRDSKVACFVQKISQERCDPFELPFIKPRSWAQYGEAQYGACFVFSKSKLLQEAKKEIPFITVYGESVNYDLDTLSSSRKSHIMFNQDLSIDENMHSHLENHRKDVFFRKYKDFADENEYRVVLVDTSEQKRKYLYFSIRKALQAVIFGERFQEVYKSVARELTLQQGAKPYILTYGKTPYVSELMNA